LSNRRKRLSFFESLVARRPLAWSSVLLEVGVISSCQLVDVINFVELIAYDLALKFV
jgi:hypothetical protein